MLTEAISNVVRLLSLTSARTQHIDCVLTYLSMHLFYTSRMRWLLDLCIDAVTEFINTSIVYRFKFKWKEDRRDDLSYQKRIYLKIIAEIKFLFVTTSNKIDYVFKSIDFIDKVKISIYETKNSKFNVNFLKNKTFNQII